MRKRNWKEYNRALVQRGSLTFLIDPKSLQTITPKRTKQKGRPQEFPLGLIEVLLLIKIHFKMPYRMLAGFTRYFLEQMKNIPIPTYSLVCKRAKNLTHLLPKLSTRRPSIVIVDATGIKVCGDGE